MDTFRVVDMALAVHRAGSFSGAARAIGVTPAAVAKQVAQLESRLGLRLFDRNTHHLAPTEEGRQWLDRVNRPLQDLRDALSAGPSADVARGSVKVSVPATFARIAVIPWLPEFQARYPDIQIDLRLENRRVDLVGEAYDCAVGAAAAQPDSSLVARTLATLRPVLCASPAYLAAHGEPRSVAELAAHRGIVMRSDSTGRLRDWQLVVRGRSHTVVPQPALQLTDPECAAAAAVAGCGIALVGMHHVAQALSDGRLLRVLPDAQGPRFQIAVSYARRRLLPPRTRAFVDHLVATVPQTAELTGPLR